MVNDLNFWFSIITAITAIIALFLSWHQTRLSNKQHLFDRRLQDYMLVNGIMGLYEKNRERLEKIDWNKPQLTIDLEFLQLTNNSYMEKQVEVMKHPLEQSYQKEFLKKLEELQLLAKEFPLIFNGKETVMFADFVTAYQEAIFIMYQYKIVINDMEKENAKHPTKLKTLQEWFGEKKHREELKAAMKKLNQTYIKVIDSNADNKIKKQIRLK